LTVLHGESDHLERIMQAAAKDLPQCCRRNSFDFITCKSVRKRDHRREDNTAVACIGFLSTCSLKSVKHLPCPKGTFCLFNDRDRQYRLLRICPFRKTESAALCTPKDAHHWVAVDSWGHLVLGDLLDLGREPVSLSKLHEGAQRAARKARSFPHPFIIFNFNALTHCVHAAVFQAITVQVAINRHRSTPSQF
jgi:hypothetical protein